VSRALGIMNDMHAESAMVNPSKQILILQVLISHFDFFVSSLEPRDEKIYAWYIAR
jgi:hypothetical protein